MINKNIEKAKITVNYDNKTDNGCRFWNNATVEAITKENFEDFIM